MKRMKWILFFTIFSVMLWNANILAIEIDEYETIYGPTKVYSDNLIISSGGILQFNSNILLEVNGDVTIQGTLSSSVNRGRSYSKPAQSDAGENGTSTNWVGGNGLIGEDGKDGKDGSNGFNLTLNVDGILRLSGKITSNGGDGGDGAKGGKGGDGGDGYTGEYRETRDDPTPSSIEFDIMSVLVNPDGGSGGKGGNGGDAGKGGNGGDIFISAKEIIIEGNGVIESKGGNNGSRGDKGDGGSGGDGGSVKHYINGNYIETFRGSDGGDGGSGGVGDSISTRAHGGSIILKTPLLSVPEGFNLSGIRYYTDEGKPVIDLELKGFSNYEHTGPDPRVIVKVHDQGSIGDIEGFDDQIEPSGIEKVYLKLDGKIVKEIPVEYEENEDLGVVKTVEFSLMDYTSGEHTIQIGAVQRNKMAADPVTLSEEFTIILRNDPPGQVNNFFAHRYLVENNTLQIEWNEFSESCGDIYYKYRLYQDNLFLDKLLAQSEDWSLSPTLNYSPYPFEKNLYFYVKAKNDRGIESGWLRYETFLTEAAPPQISKCYYNSSTSSTYTGILSMSVGVFERKKFYVEVYEKGKEQPLVTDNFFASTFSPDYVVTGLKPHIEYVFKVWSVNSEGKVGSVFDQAVLTIPNRLPVKPEEFHASPDGVCNPAQFSIDQFYDPDGDEIKYYLIVEEYNPATGKYSILSGYNEVLMNVNADGTVTYDASNLIDGNEYRWTVKVQDNWEENSGSPIILESLDIRVDRIPPVISINYPRFVKKPEVEFAFSVDSSVKSIDLSFAGETIENINLTGYTLSLPFEEEDYNGTFIAYDEAGNSTRVNFNIKLDMTAPETPVFKDLSQFIFYEDKIKIAWTCMGDNPGGSGLTGYYVRWNGGISYNSEDSYFTIPDLKSNEDILVEVCSVDGAGNTSSNVSLVLGTLPAFNDEDGYSYTFGYTVNDGIYQLYRDYTVNAEADQYRVNKGNQLGEWKTIDQPTRIPVTSRESYNLEIELRNTFKPVFDSGTVSVKSSKIVSQTIPNNPPGYPDNTLPNYVNNLQPVLTYNLTMPDLDGDPLRVIYELRSEIDGKVIQFTDMEGIQLTEGVKYDYRVGVKDDFMDEYLYSDWTWFVIDCTPPNVFITPEYNGEWVKELNISISARDNAMTDPGKNSGVKAVAYSWNTPPTEDQWQEGSLINNVFVPVGINTLYVKTKDAVGNIGEKIFTGHFKVDVTEPDITNLGFVEAKLVNDQKYWNISDQIQFNFDIIERESGLDYLGYALITEDEYFDYQNLSEARFTEINVSNQLKEHYTCVVNKSLQENVKYYVVVKARNRAGIESCTISDESIIIDATPPIISSVEITGIVTEGGYHYIKDFGQFSINPIFGESGVIFKYGLTNGSGVEEPESDFRELDFSPIQIGESFYLRIKAMDGLNNYSLKTVGPFVYDNTQPVIEDVKLGSTPDYVQNYIQRDNSQLMINWTIGDEVPLKQVRYAIGRTPGGKEVTGELEESDAEGWIALSPVEGRTGFLLKGLNLENGEYYLTVMAENILGLITTKTSPALKLEVSSVPEPKVFTPGVSSIISEINFKVIHPDYQDMEFYEYRVKDKNGIEIISGIWDEVCKTSDETLINVVLGEATLTAGVSYYVEVKGVTASGETPIGYSNGMVIDLTQPVVNGLIDQGYIGGDLVVINYDISEDYSKVPVDNVEIKVGTTPDNGDITGGWIRTDNLNGINFDGEDFVDGQKYFIRLRVFNTAGLETNVTGSFTYDNSRPPVPVVVDGGEYSLPTDKIRINWEPTALDAHSGLDHFEYAITMSRSAIGITDWRIISETDLEKIDLDGDGILDSEIYAMWVQHDTLLQHGNTYYVAIKSINKAGLYSIGFSDGLTIDSDAPSSMEVMVNDHCIAELDSEIVASLQAVENVSEIEKYVHWAGTYDNEYKISGPVESTDNLVTIQGLFEQGDWIYVKGRAVNSVGLVSHQGISNGILIDAGSPQMNSVNVGFTQFDKDTQSISFYWDATPSGVSISRYRYLFTKDPNGSTGLSGEITSENIKFTGPFENGQTYYLFVSAIDEKGFTSDTLRSEGVLVALPPAKPVITQSGLYYSPNNLTFSWSRLAEDVIGGYRWAIGSFMGDDDITGGWIYINEETEIDWANIRELLTMSVDASEYVGLMEHDSNYYFKVEACNPGGQYSKTGLLNFKIDKTLPEKPVMNYQGYTDESEILQPLYTTDANCISDLRVSSRDIETGIIRYRYQIVSDSDTTSLKTSTVPPMDPSTESFSFNAFSDLPLTEGETYNVVVSVQNGVGDWSEVGFSPPIVVDTIPPVISFAEPGNVVTNGENMPILWNTDEVGEAVITLTLPEDHPDWSATPQSVTKIITAVGEQSFDFVETHYGVYELRIVQYDIAGNKSAVIQKLIRINHPPIVYINQIDSLYQGHSVDFYIVSCYDPDYVSETDPEGVNAIAGYNWKLNGVSVSNTDTAEFTFTEKGIHEMILEVTDIDGGIGLGKSQIKVTNTLSGELKMDEIWEEDLRLEGTVIVPDGLKLTILPGVEAVFPGDSGLEINGSIDACGLSNSPIRLLGSDEMTETWGGVIVRTAGESSLVQTIQLEYLDISSAARGLSLLDFPGGLVLDNVSLRKNLIGLHLYNTNVELRFCSFTDNRYYGIKEDGNSKSDLIECNFSGNGAAPLYDESGTLMKLEELEIRSVGQ